jgi:hypothetical protein
MSITEARQGGGAHVGATVEEPHSRAWAAGDRWPSTGEGGMGGSDVRPEEGRGFRGAPEPAKPVVGGARAGR